MKLLRMSKYRFIVYGFCFLLLACGSKKKVVDDRDDQAEVINPRNEVALTGAVNFDDDESLSIYSAILKNVTGGKPGAYIGYKMDQLANDLEKNLKSTELLRVGEGVILEFSSLSKFTFMTGKSSLSADSKQILDIIVKALDDYPKMNIIIETHTDTSGEEIVNMELSQKRASSIQNYLIDKGVDANRIKTKAFGENNPKVDEINLENKQMNRRIEIGFYASELLKDEAKDNTK